MASFIIFRKKDILNYFPNVNVQIVSDGIDFDSFQNQNRIENKEILKKYLGKDFFRSF